MSLTKAVSITIGLAITLISSLAFGGFYNSHTSENNMRAVTGYSGNGVASSVNYVYSCTTTQMQLYYDTTTAVLRCNYDRTTKQLRPYYDATTTVLQNNYDRTTMQLQLYYDTYYGCATATRLSYYDTTTATLRRNYPTLR